MKCSRCGMPLSPARTHCPRCGTPIPGKAEKNNPAQPYAEHAGWQPANQAQSMPEMVGQEAAQQSWANTPAGPAGWGTPAPQMSFEAPTFADNAQAAPPQAASGWSPQPAYESTPFFQPGSQQRGPAEKKSSFAPSGRNVMGLLSSPRSGFTLAGSCIAAGMLILLFVFIMARALPATSASTTNQANTQTTQTVPTPEPTMAPTPDPSPTATTLPGQQYFDNAQLGSEINDNTAQIMTQASNFKVGQKIYVTFQVHTGAQLGAACLAWTWGNHSQTHFAFPLQGSSGAAYSYMPAVAAGDGKVEIYYASSTACSDQVLAQSVPFVVS